MKYTYPPGATPLDLNEAAALIPKHITVQRDLNEWEQMNILEAENWAFRKKHTNLLSIEFIQKLHKKMFDQTWIWAGQFRKTLKNIGVDFHQIPLELRKLCDDTSYQLEHQSYPLDEIAARLHHRLVWIHPFPNGNGRHARWYADMFLVANGDQRFSWGRDNLSSFTQTRNSYIYALQQADRQHFTPLLEFVRS